MKQYAPEKLYSGKSGGKWRNGKHKAALPAQSPEPEPIPESFWEALPPLPDEWAASLVETRGWSREVMTRLDLRLACIGKTERVAIPIRDEQGRLLNIRKYSPGAAEIKVLSESGHGQVRLWPYIIRTKNNLITWLCEGEADTICALSHGLKAITATGGAGSWPKEGEKIFKGRDVVIAYDADLAGYNRAHKVAAHLAKVADRVRILIWPDQMLAPEPVEDESKVQAQKRAQAALSASRDNIRYGYVPYLPAKHGQDLTDFLVKLGRSVDDLRALLVQAELIEVREGELKTSRFWGLNPGNNLVFKPALLTAEIIKEMDLITDPDSGLIYNWCGTHYKLISRQALEAVALGKLGHDGTSAQVRDAINQVELLTRLADGESFNQAPRLLCLPNGMLDLKTAKILPHDRKYRATYLVPWEFDPKRPMDCLRWKRYLHETMSIWAAMELQEFMGYMFWPDNRFETMMFVVGGRGTGKSTLLDVLQHLVGEEYCSNVDLEEIEDLPLRARLATSRLNVCDESDTKSFTTKHINTIVSGKRIGARHLYKEAFEFRPTCKMVFATNRFPATRSYDEALYDRLLLLMLTNRFRNTAKQDPYLKEKLFAEAQGIFAWSMVGLYNLYRRGRLLRTRATLEALNEYRRDNDPMREFWSECLTTDEDEAQNGRMVVQKDEVYEAFVEWCKKSGYSKPPTRPTFCKRMYELGEDIPDLKPETKDMFDRNRRPSFRGIGLRYI